MKKKLRAEQHSLVQKQTELQRSFDLNPPEDLRLNTEATTTTCAEAQEALLFAKLRIYE